MNAAVKARARKFTLEVLPVSKGIKEKLAKEGLDHETLIQIHQLGSERGLLSIIALPKTYRQIASKTKHKPRVTKDVKILTKIVNYFRANVVPT